MNKVVTIGREFGSGGREIGYKLAQKLGQETVPAPIGAVAGGVLSDNYKLPRAVLHK